MGRNEMGQLRTAIATSAEDGQAVLDDSDIHPSALAILSQNLYKETPPSPFTPAVRRQQQDDPKETHGLASRASVWQPGRLRNNR